jgi:hypothetical protein
MATSTIDSAVLERHLKRTTLVSNVVSVIIALAVSLSAGYGFYYKTTNTLQNHTLQIEEVKVNVETLTDKVNNSAIFQGASAEQMKSLETQVNDVKSSQVRIEEKLDRLIMKSTK